MFTAAQITCVQKEDIERVEHYIEEYVRSDMAYGKVEEVVHAAMEGKGKRLRPQLLLMVGRYGEKYEESRDRLCKLGALVELIHTASLIHDDIIDDSPLRRNRPSIQCRFGKETAVYTGDLLLSRVLYILLRENLRESGMILGKTIEDMCRGEIGQFLCRYRTETTMEEYREHIYGKTAAVFVATCKVAAIESGCDSRTTGLLSELGEQFGYLFQMADDLKDFVSDAAIEGKPVHQDFKDGIYTLPVLYALQQPAYSSYVRDLAEKQDLTQKDLAMLNQLVFQSGGIDFMKNRMQYHASEVDRIIRSLPENEAGETLLRLLDTLCPVRKYSHIA